MKKLNILYLEDNELDLKLITICLNAEKLKYDLTHVETKKEFTSALDNKKFDLILSDYYLPEFNALEALSISKIKAPNIPFIIVSGSIGEDLTIDALKKGATDYVLKINIKRLIPVIHRAIKEKQETAELKQAERIQKALFNIANAVNTTKSLSELVDTIRALLGEIIDTTNCYIAIYNEKSDTFTLPYYEDEHDKKVEIPSENTFTGYVAKTGKSLLADKKKIDELVKSGEVKIIGTPAKVWLGIPLKSTGKIIGIFVVQSYTDSNLYTQKELKILEFVSHHIALAIERKLYEESLQQRNTFIENIIHNLPIGLTVSSLDKGKIKYINPKFEEILGCSKQNTSSIHDFFKCTGADKSLKNSFNKNFLNNIENSDNSQFSWNDVTIQSSDKKEKVISIINIPLRNDNLIITALQDVTKRIQAEEKISVLSDAVKFSPVSVIITDSKGIIEYINPKFTEISGYTEKEVLGKKPNILKSGNQSEEVYKELWETITNDNEWKGEFQNKKKSGELFWESVSISPVKNNRNKITHFIGVKEDITNRKKDEEILKKSKDKAEESDKLKSSFLANMSHEIRTPMNAIIGFSELLTEKYVSEDQKKVFVDQIHTNCDSLLHLIDDILDISKIEARQMVIDEMECQVNKLMTDLFTNFLNSIKKSKKKIELKLSTPNKDENFTILTDFFRLKQVIANLVENAIKFTHNGFVEFGYILKENANTLEFFIKDTGIGIPKDKINFIFERFTKIEEDKINLYGGTGLGLAISKNLVSLIGGEIWVKSEINKGSTFHFTIPLKIGTPVVIKKLFVKESIISYNWDGKTILIAEDEESNYNYLAEILSNTDANVLWAKNGKEAIDLFKSSKVDIILMDMKMPKIDGYEATRQIKQLNPEIPIIAQTAFALTNEKEKCFKAGCNDFISKPIRAKKLFDIIQRLIS